MTAAQLVALTHQPKVAGGKPITGRLVKAYYTQVKAAQMMHKYCQDPKFMVEVAMRMGFPAE